MYKVFIDHKPILFVNESELIPSLDSLSFERLTDFSSGIQLLLKNVTIDSPLQIVCENVDVAFKDAFKEYKIVEAAGGVVNNNDKLLMIFRNGMWDIPKGFIEKHEEKEHAAIREVEEECGISGPEINSFLCETYHTYELKKKRILKKTTWYAMAYDKNDVLIPQIDEGITEVKWFAKEEFLNVRGNTYGSINEVIDQYQLLFFEN